MRLISYDELRPGDIIATVSQDTQTIKYYFVIDIQASAVKSVRYFTFLLTTTSGVRVIRMSDESKRIFATKGSILR